MESRNHGPWYAMLSPREQATADHAISYAKDFSPAGVPGHSAHLLIAKLAGMLDVADEAESITAAVSPTQSIDDAIGAIQDIAELVGWPCFDSDQADDNFSMQFKRGAL